MTFEQVFEEAKIMEVGGTKVFQLDEDELIGPMQVAELVASLIKQMGKGFSARRSGKTLVITCYLSK